MQTKQYSCVSTLIIFTIKVKQCNTIKDFFKLTQTNSSISCLSGQHQVTYVHLGNDQYIDDCKLPQIISQTLTSDGVLTQILPEGTSYEIASDYSSVVLKDSVAKSTKVLKVTGGDSFEISLDKNRLIFKGWSEIGQ